jgi:hypothetical protein
MASKRDKIVRSDPRSPRYFKACDVARIAENCVEDTGTPEYIVLACIAKRLGYSRVWVEDKDQALQSDKYSLKQAAATLVSEVEQDVSDVSIFTSGQGDQMEALMQKTVDRAALAAERGIGIATMTAVEAFEEGFSVLLNWMVYRLYFLLRKLPNAWGYVIIRFIGGFVDWLASMLEGFTHSISVDVDDVLQANPDWCTCMQADRQDGFQVDEKAAKEFGKNRKKSKLPSLSKPTNIPTTIGG